MRLAGYDYATPGAYFITACVHGRKNEFGIVENDVMQLNEYGLIVEQQWKWLFDQYDYLKTGEYCVMPNHFHGIIQITVGNGRDRSLRMAIVSTGLRPFLTSRWENQINPGIDWRIQNNIVQIDSYCRQ